MKIFLSPQRRDGSLSVLKAGDVLTLNGESFDFSDLPDGETIEAGVVPCDWIGGKVQRIGGDLQLTLVLPCGPKPPFSVAFPDDIIDPPDGEVSLPSEEE